MNILKTVNGLLHKNEPDTEPPTLATPSGRRKLPRTVVDNGAKRVQKVSSHVAKVKKPHNIYKAQKRGMKVKKGARVRR